MLIFYCQCCSRELKTELSNAGKPVKCPECHDVCKAPELPVLLDDEAPRPRRMLTRKAS